MNVDVRLYRPDDWPQLCAIHDRARVDELRGSVDLAAFIPLERSAEPEGLFDGELWVACVGERVVGYVAAADDEITWLYVAPDCYRRGIGRTLLRHAIARCGPVVTTEVLIGNSAAIQLYTTEGFEIVETRSGKLNGAEQFPATGHIMRLRKSSRPTSAAAGP